MRSSRTPQDPDDVPSRSIAAFVAITFAITWSVIGLYVLAPERGAAWFGEIDGSHPLFFLATWAPAIAAVALVLWYAGPAGLRRFASRLLLWRTSPAWAAFVLVGLPLVFVAGSLIGGVPVTAQLPPEGAWPLLAILPMMLFLGPIEEFGWRGLAQPVLQRHMAPIWAGLLIGATWGVWHLPAFFLSSTVYAEWSFLPFFIGNVTLGVLVTPILNRSHGGLLWPTLFHWQLINPFWPDAQPWDTVILVAVTVVVVWWNGDSMLSRGRAATVVVPPGATGPAP